MKLLLFSSAVDQIFPDNPDLDLPLEKHDIRETIHFSNDNELLYGTIILIDLDSNIPISFWESLNTADSASAFSIIFLYSNKTPASTIVQAAKFGFHFLDRTTSKTVIESSLKSEAWAIDQKVVFNTIIESTPSLICSYKPDFTLTLMNKTYERYFGITRKDFLGESFLKLIPEEEHDSVINTIKGLNKENPEKTYTHPVLNAHGEKRIVEWTDRAFFERNGKPVIYHSIGRDVTELSNALERNSMLLLELQHRVKNSFMLMSGMLELMKENWTSQESIALIEELQSRTAAIAELYDLLYDSGSVQEVRLDTYLEKTARSVIGISSNLDLSIDLQPITIATKQAIPVGIILAEMITNAIKHAFQNQPEPTLSLFLRREKEEAILIVKDNGNDCYPKQKVKNKKSTGLKLMNVLAKQMKGVLTIAPSDFGTCCSIRFQPDFEGKQSSL